MIRNEGIVGSAVAIERFKINFGKIAIWAILALLAVDAVYSVWFGINLHTRDRCVIYSFLPQWLFLAYEYLIELFMVVVAGAFAGTLAEKYFSRFRKFMPRNQMMAFLYASLIPVCSCSAIPLIESMKNRLSLRTIITFVMAAPLLNPYIIMLSYSILGFKYGTLRIIGSFLISIITGLIIEAVYIRIGKPEVGIYKSCEPSSCNVSRSNDIYSKTWNLISKIAPYILIAGVLGLVFELIGPVKIFESLPFNSSLLSSILVILIGIPIYFCNGADVLFLTPLLEYTDLGLGNAIAFSLTSTAICASSIVMLAKFLGKRLTVTLIFSTIIITVLYSFLINLIF